MSQNHRDASLRMLGEVLGNGGLVCDFCGASEIARSYPCADFAVITPLAGVGSEGAWAACAE